MTPERRQIEAAEHSVALRAVLFALAIGLIVALSILVAVPKAHAKGGRHGLITVTTDAGPITVAPEFAPKIVPFINAVIALTGQKPRSLKCFSLSSSHVAGSLHFVGRACDFAQSGWGHTSYKVMYRISALARAYGLRDGCEFRDWGHIDDGPHLPSARTRGCKSGPFIAYSQMQQAVAAP